jgi:16S rRNA (cytidine1402-2'-O)-methyltransferase
MEFGTLFLIPNYLGNNSYYKYEENIKKIIYKLNYFIFENEKPGRAFIKNTCPKKNQSELIIQTLNKFTEKESFINFLEPCFQGKNIGLISDAGCPAIADPGASLISLAHESNITVKPFVGPSSILLALMASGLNGQNFKFNGYLPIEKNERREKIKNLEKNSYLTTQIFMETPYRNNNLMNDLLKVLKLSTKLCVATDLNLENELIRTKTIEKWKDDKVKYHKRPSIFLIQSE